MAATPAGSDVGSLRSGSSGGRGDAIFRRVTLSAGLFVFVLLAAIAVFLIVKAEPELAHDPSNFLSTTQFDASSDTYQKLGIGLLLFGTIMTALLALVMAVPIAVGIALFITNWAPTRIATILGYISDLLAAVPSVVYGFFAIDFLLQHLIGFNHFLADYFGWIPIFSDPNHQTQYFSKSIFAASLILAVMILPIVAAISREVFRQTDPAHKEAALALGATRWEVVRTAVIPPAVPGVVSAMMLGLGRALGETIAVALVIGGGSTISHLFLVPGGNTIAANIAAQFGEASPIGRSALIASGLVLFAITLLVNLFARIVIARSGTRDAAAV